MAGKRHFRRFPAIKKSAPRRPLIRQSGSRSGARDFLEVDLDPRAHGRADRDLVDELALRARRLGLDDGVHERGEILLEVAFGEARLADPGLDDAGLLDPELD